MRIRISPAPAIALLLAALAALTLAFPTEAIHAALKGMSIWWDVLFPALFPFFVISEMMLGVGIVHFFGTLLDPLMRPVFRIPGIGGFVMAMGFASGYPIGARLTSQLWEQRLVNRAEGERLVAFTTSSDPIFLIGAVSVGFFHNPELALVLGTAHYGAAMVIGLLMRFHGGRGPVNKGKNGGASAANPALSEDRRLWRRAFDAMHEARMKDGRSLGTMLQQAVGSGLQLIFVVGGLVVFFAVVMEVLRSARVMPVFYEAINAALQLFHVPLPLSQAIANGFFEVTLGAKAAGEATGVPLVYQTAIAAWVLSWAGLSVHAQVVSLLHHTDLRYWPFALARFAHALLAALLVIVLWTPLAPATAALAPLLPSPDVTQPLTTLIRYTFPAAGGTFALLLVSLLAATIIFLIGKRCMKGLRF